MWLCLPVMPACYSFSSFICCMCSPACHTAYSACASLSVATDLVAIMPSCACGLLPVPPACALSSPWGRPGDWLDCLPTHYPIPSHGVDVCSFCDVYFRFDMQTQFKHAILYYFAICYLVCSLLCLFIYHACCCCLCSSLLGHGNTVISSLRPIGRDHFLRLLDFPSVPGHFISIYHS